MRGIASGRIWYQSFTDPDADRPYFTRLGEYLGSVASPGCQMEVSGIQPGARYPHPITEFRCAAHVIANALTAEINASFLSIGGLHWTSSRRQAFTGEGEPPVARTTRNRRACSAKTTSSRGLWAIGGGMRRGNLNVRKPVPDHRRQPFLNLNQG